MRNKYNLAELRYYEKGNTSIKLSDRLSYVFIERMDDYSHDYQNVFKNERFPIVKRNNIYADNYFYFEENASAVFERCGESGLCYVLTNVSVDNLPIEDLKHIVLYSDHYFKDRKDLMEEMLESEYNTSLRRTMFDDITNYEQMVNYLSDKGIDFENGGKKLVR